MKCDPVSDSIPNRCEVLVLGGGVTGISLAALLGENGQSTVLLEKDDFASGTSQASGMMIWGGLLYLKNFEFGLVRCFCRARDRLIRNLDGEIHRRSFTYLGLEQGGRNRLVVWLALQCYQALSLWRRSPMKRYPLGNLDPLFDPRHFKGGWSYEEGFLGVSDAHFAVQRLQEAGGEVHPFNYCDIIGIDYLTDDGRFAVKFRDRLNGREFETRARKVVNCGGVWAEEINARFGIRTSHTHHLSKGVYLLLPAPACPDALIMDMEDHGDTICWVPWGEVAMWGPTETMIDHLDQAGVNSNDIDFLLAKLNRFSTRVWTRQDIVNVRCGVRPLAKRHGQKVGYPLDLSRRGVVEKAPDRPWWTVFGGKLSGAADLAGSIYQSLYRHRPESTALPVSPPVPPVTSAWFGGRPLPDPAYCRDFQYCRTLEDYLRRRTNLAQWIPRSGFGENFEFERDMIAIATILADDQALAEVEVERYKQSVLTQNNAWNEQSTRHPGR